MNETPEAGGEGRSAGVARHGRILKPFGDSRVMACGPCCHSGADADRGCGSRPAGGAGTTGGEQASDVAPTSSPALVQGEDVPTALDADGSSAVRRTAAAFLEEPDTGPDIEAPGEVSPHIFSSKMHLADGDESYSASVGSLSEGNRRTLMVDPNGGYFWGDFSLESKRDVGRVIGGHKDFVSSKFATGKEAREAGAATPQTRTAPFIAGSQHAWRGKTNCGAGRRLCLPRRTGLLHPLRNLGPQMAGRILRPGMTMVKAQRYLAKVRTPAAPC